MSFNLSEYFSYYFSLVVANTPELLDQVYQIRYQVYCEELDYELKSNFPDRLEKDFYDSRSIHCLLQHHPSGRYIGCVRIVLPNWEQLEELFPVEKICTDTIALNPTSRLNYAEISRLAVIADFRRRQGEQNTSSGLLFSELQNSPLIIERRKFSLIPLSLYLACTTIVNILNIKSVITLMEARLSRHLRRCDIPSRQVGNFIDFHGQRAPFLLSTEEVINNLSAEIRGLFDNIYSQLESSVYFHPLSQNYRL
jgi:N-acyl amino acid synthase of PEP-CTERM/exosortase system